jgi:hypothetical protein
MARAAPRFTEVITHLEGAEKGLGRAASLAVFSYRSLFQQALQSLLAQS